MGDLSSRRHLEPFFGAGVCLYLWHFKCFLNYTLEAFPISRDPWRASSGNFVSLIEGRKDKGFELCNKSNFQKYPTSNNTASVFDIILRIYAQVEKHLTDPIQELHESLYFFYRKNRVHFGAQWHRENEFAGCHSLSLFHEKLFYKRCY